MTATTRPADLDAWKGVVRAETGLSAIEVGDLPDPTHKSSGGRHCGVQDIKDIGRYIPPAAGKTTDYSVKQLRDRVGGNATSASDIGDDWPRGGREAWLRFGWNVAWELQHSPASLPALCEINWLDDEGRKKRYYVVDGRVIDSTDSVDIHTHLGFWRDTADTPARAHTFARLRAHLVAARDDISVTAALAKLNGDDMSDPSNWGVVQTRLFQLLNDDDVTGTGTFVANNRAKTRQVAAHKELLDAIKAIGTPTLSAADIAELAEQVAAVLIAAPDVPVSDADSKKIAQAVRDVFAAQPLK